VSTSADAPRLKSLDAIQAEVWRQLDAAIDDNAHPWRTPVLATINGHLADARTVVLREVQAREQRFLIYTDERASKVSQLLSHPIGTLVMWSQPLGWQLRCRVHLAIEMSGLAASSRWARIKLSPAAQDYLSPLPPGSVIGEPDVAPTHAPVARDYFSIITAQVLSLDWLELHELGHRRARFDGGKGVWLQP
jgi:pyridoxamine 5'-phosphate oxidase